MQRPEPLIRHLTGDDYSSLLALWQRAGLHSIRPEGRDSQAAIEQQLATEVQTILGLELDGVLIGTVVTTHDTRKGWINRLAIDPRYRNQGYGKLLVRAAEARLREQGMPLTAALIEHDNVASLRLFQSLGYSEIDEGIHYLTKRDSENV
ncbi:MAG: GNAT family N-acetyltransferase [Chloroflexi bacterium]|nr:GNAT family N-acetyltransferase [Chloroflexota bacterium]